MTIKISNSFIENINRITKLDKDQINHKIFEVLKFDNIFSENTSIDQINWEQRKVSDILDFEQPNNYILKNDHYAENGIPVLTANKAFVLGYTNENNPYSKGNCIIFDDFTLDSKYVDFPFKINSSVIKILTSKDNKNLKFYYYLLNQIKIAQHGHARHYISIIQPIKVYVPKQDEITRIEKLLTNFDNLITLHQHK